MIRSRKMWRNIDTRQPVNWGDSANVNLLSWMQVIPQRAAGEWIINLVPSSLNVLGPAYNDGELLNGVEWSSAHRPGGFGSLFFPGNATNHVSMPANTAVRREAAFTISAWIKPDSDALSGTHVIYSEGPDTIFHLRLNGTGQFEFSRDPDNDPFSGQKVTSTTTTLVADQWYFLAATFSTNNGMKSYINGVLEGTNADDRLSIHEPEWVRIGGNGVEFPFAGHIDDVRVYDREWTADQLTTEYHRAQEFLD